jgi:hypothetical protein
MRPNSRQVPAWSINGGNYPTIPDEPSRWDQFLAAEGLDEDGLKHSSKVQKFVVQHYRTYFIPVKILKMYGLEWPDA